MVLHGQVFTPAQELTYPCQPQQGEVGRGYLTLSNSPLVRRRTGVLTQALLRLGQKANLSPYPFGPPEADSGQA